MRLRVVFAFLLGVFVQGCFGSGCLTDHQADPGGGGCIVLSSEVAEDVTAEQAASGDALTVGVSLSFGGVFLDSIDGGTTLMAEGVSAVSSYVVGLQNLSLFLSASSCQDLDSWQRFDSNGPISIFSDTAGGDDITELQLPLGQEICGTSVVWAGGVGGLPSFLASGTLTSGADFEVESHLFEGVFKKVGQTVFTDSSLKLKLTIEPERWLSVIGDFAWTQTTGTALVNQDMHADVLAEIEIAMQDFTFLEVNP